MYARLPRGGTDANSLHAAVTGARDGVADVVAEAKDRGLVLALFRDEDNRAFVTHGDGWRACVQTTDQNDWATTGYREFDERGLWGAIGWCIEGAVGEVRAVPVESTPLVDDR